MGVFERFRRKSKEAATASTEETPTATRTAEPMVQAPPDDSTPEAGTAEGVEIPKQQSAEEAADNEAGEGARK
ncbi:hypothetical protein GCM10020367_48290 [Streptomyces sannanensis]|uniref:Gliding motility protein n=1 Tax=Streptomyces sannanensis TaxID=285536 RepID=A0ABP6SH61_9ACTN